MGRNRPFPAERCSFTVRNDVLEIPRSRTFANTTRSRLSISGRFPAVSAVTVGLGGKCLSKQDPPWSLNSRPPSEKKIRNKPNQAAKV